MKDNPRARHPLRVDRDGYPHAWPINTGTTPRRTPPAPEPCWWCGRNVNHHHRITCSPPCAALFHQWWRGRPPKDTTPQPSTAAARQQADELADLLDADDEQTLELLAGLGGLFSDMPYRRAALPVQTGEYCGHHQERIERERVKDRHA